MSNSNPYYNQAGIEDPTMFFGRQREIEGLLSAVFANSPQCLSIVGQRKIGKTSLILHLMNETTLVSHGYSLENRMFVYFNCQKYHEQLKSVASFMVQMVELLTMELMLDADTPITRTLRSRKFASQEPDQQWNILVKALELHDLRVVYIFDEFDKAIATEALIKDGLFGRLRAYASDSKSFSWLTSTREPLPTLFERSFHHYEVSELQRKSESDFFNIAVPLLVGPFASPLDVKKLVFGPSKANGVDFTERDFEVVVNFGGNFPFFLQRACWHLFALRERIDQTSMDYRKLIKTLEFEAMPLWNEYWENIQDNQPALYKVVTGHQGDISTAEKGRLTTASLVRINNSTGQLEPLSESFGRFVEERFLTTTYSAAQQNQPKIDEYTTVENTSSKLRQADVADHDTEKSFLDWRLMFAAIAGVILLFVVIMVVSTWVASVLPQGLTIAVLIVTLVILLLSELVVLRLLGLLTDEQVTILLGKITERIPVLGASFFTELLGLHSLKELPIDVDEATEE